MSISNTMMEWAAGGALALAIPFALKWLGGKGIDMLKAWELRKLQELLGAKTGDPALDEFNRDLVLAVAKLAQAKMPKDGMGPERKKMLMDFLTSKFPWFRGKEAALSVLVDRVVSVQQEVLDSVGKPQRGIFEAGGPQA